jgi:hypothetical protein
VKVEIQWVAANARSEKRELLMRLKRLPQSATVRGADLSYVHQRWLEMITKANWVVRNPIAIELGLDRQTGATMVGNADATLTIVQAPARPQHFSGGVCKY